MVKTKGSSMRLNNYNSYFFFGILVLISVLAFFIFKPFLVAILLAAILAVLFQPLYNFFLSITKKHRRISSLITSLIILLLIIIPITVISILIGNEIITAYQSVNGSGDFYQNYVVPVFNEIQSSELFKIFGLNKIFNEEAFAQYLGQAGQLVLVFLQNAYKSVAHIVFMIFVMFFSLYYFFIDGKGIVKKVMYISPLRDSHENLLIRKFISISKATIKGNLVIAVIQGTIGAVLFSVLGMKSAVIWGVAMMFFSLLPVMGTSFVWFPVGLIMLILGNIWEGITILIIGFTLISSIDNVLSPKLIGKDTQMHPLLVFFAILGGLPLFGLMGFIVGPIVMALFVSLWDIYGIEFKRQLNRYNA